MMTTSSDVDAFLFVLFVDVVNRQARHETPDTLR